MTLLRRSDLLGRLNRPKGQLHLESSSYDVSASDSQDIAAASWEDVPDMSISFDCARASTYLVFFSIRMNSITTYSNGPYRCWVRLNVDAAAGESWGDQCFRGDEGKYVSTLVHSVLSLDAGSHTVKMQCYAEGASGGRVIRRRLTIIRVNQ